MRAPILALALALLSALLAAPPACASQRPGSTWEPGGGAWRSDPAWYDGKAEKCTYEAARTIYGLSRAYEAVAYTNKQKMDPRTQTKSEPSEEARGVEVFKHHWSERVPTESYDYDFSIATFTRADDLAPFKLQVGTQEDCGASFKLAWLDGGRLRWLESVYFPGAGLRQGELPRGAPVHFADQLTLLLRDFPFETPAPRELSLVPSQVSNKSVPFEPFRAQVSYAGREELELPAGSIDAHHLRVEGGDLRAELWFAADGSAPMLHALVRYEDAAGTSYRLKSIERTAYWERP